MRPLFDVHDKEKYFVEDITREDAEQLLKNRESGTFLIRNSVSNEGDLALSITEQERVGHYHIKVRQQRNSTEYVIGERSFPSLPDLLTFYKIFYLNDEYLKYPIYNEIPTVVVTQKTSDSEVVPRLARVIRQRVPNSYEPNALRLEVNDIVVVTNTDISGTWQGRRLSGNMVQEGYFPFNFVEFVGNEEEERLRADSTISPFLL